MKRSLVVLNLTLLGTALLLGYSLGRQWHQFQVEHDLDLLKRGSQPVTSDPGAPSPSEKTPNFSAIVDHHLFNSDRNNQLIQEPQAKPQQVLPGPLPILMGTVEISDEAYALMVSNDSQASNSLYRRLKVGQDLDGYTLIRIDMDRVTMKAGDTEVKVGINDQPKRPRPPARSARAARRRPTDVGSQGKKGGASTGTATQAGSSSRSVAVPVGTVRDGRRLVSVPSPFGEIKTWVEDKSAKPSP